MWLGGYRIWKLGIAVCVCVCVLCVCFTCRSSWQSQIRIPYMGLNSHFSSGNAINSIAISYHALAMPASTNDKLGVCKMTVINKWFVVSNQVLVCKLFSLHSWLTKIVERYALATFFAPKFWAVHGHGITPKICAGCFIIYVWRGLCSSDRSEETLSLLSIEIP